MKNKILIIFLALLASTILLAGCAGENPVTLSATGNTYYVTKTGSDSNPGTISLPWLTIQKAVSSVSAGSTIYVREGTYNELVNIRVSGTADSPIIISSYPNEKAIINAGGIDPGTFGNCKQVVTISGSYITLRDLEITYPLGCGVLININSNYDLLYNLKIHDIFQGGISNRGNYNIIENNEVWNTNMSNSCPAHDGCGYSYWSAGIGWGDTTYPNTGLNTIVRNNIVHDNYGEGIIGMYTSGSIVEGNIAYDNWALGIYSANSSNFIVRNNLVYYTTNKNYWRFGTSAPPGIMIADEYQITGQPNGNNIKIYNNIMVNCGYGFYFWIGKQPGAGLIDDVISNNTIVNNLAGIGIRIEGGAHKNTIIENNIIQIGSSATPLSLSTQTGLTFTHNLWSKAPYPSLPADIVANPLLVDSGRSVDTSINTDWYKLTANSPAINAGLANSIVTDDFSGNVRPQGSGYDIGAFEYVEGIPPTTSTPTLTATSIPIPTLTSTPTATVTATKTSTPTKTVTPAVTNTPTWTSTPTPTPKPHKCNHHFLWWCLDWILP